MHAIILAAGEGKRFFTGDVEARALPAGLSYPVPKCLYPVKDPRDPAAPPLPVLERLLAAMVDAGVEHVHVATGHLGEKVETWLAGSRFSDIATILPPVAGIDTRKGPLFTLAGALSRLNGTGLLVQAGFDKIVFLCPADLVIDRKAFWYISGTPARGMMASRSMVHLLVDDRGPPAPVAGSSSTLRALVPDRFVDAVPSIALDAPLVPVMALHLDILIDSVSWLSRGATTFAGFFKSWLDERPWDEREFRVNMNIIPASNLGSSFAWHDVDTFQHLLAGQL